MNIQTNIRKPKDALKPGDKPVPPLAMPADPLLQPGDAVMLGGRTEKNSRLFGKIGKFIAKLPKAARHFPRFIKAALVGGIGVGLRLAAGSLGLVGMAGLGLAGALEVREGIKEKDAIKVIGGTGEIVRGGFTGLLSLGHIIDLGKHAGGVAAATGILGTAQGGLHITSGVLKFTEGRKKDVKRRRIEGMLEIGMGVASLAMVTGAMTPLAVGTYAALTMTRFGVVNWEKICENASKAKAKTKEMWQDFKNEFKDEDEVKPKPPKVDKTKPALPPPKP